MSTVSLQMIVKDEFDPVVELLSHAYEYFDEINLTVSDKPTANKLTKELKDNPAIHVKYREWNNHFDDARNANYAMSTTDYQFWLDADDTFDFRAIPKLVKIADEGDYGAIFLPYNYAQDEKGNCVVRHWRERLTSKEVPFEWRGWVHESLISDEPYTSHRVNVEVKHNATREHAAESVGRNHAILEEAAKVTRDPRYIHYLGMSYFTNQQYEKAIDTLEDYIEVGGSVEDLYRSMTIISEASYHLNQYSSALEWAMKATVMIPEYPMAYWLLAQYEADQENWKEALEWIRTSESKPDPDTLSIWDPTSRERAALIGARCEFMLENFKAALAWLRKAPNQDSAQQLLPEFIKEADAETFIALLPNIRTFFSSDEALYNALAKDLRFDKRLQTLRFAVTEPKKWDEKSIVFLCGQGYEDWGPQTQDKGMGGSEEAVLYLSRELVKLGYAVTIYGAVPELQTDQGVTYIPWKEFDPRDHFDVFVAWRAPEFANLVEARVKLADIHDVIEKEKVKPYKDLIYMFKSEFHKALYPDLPDENSRVVGNGLVKEQFS